MKILKDKDVAWIYSTSKEDLIKFLDNLKDVWDFFLLEELNTIWRKTKIEKPDLINKVNLIQVFNDHKRRPLLVDVSIDDLRKAEKGF